MAVNIETLTPRMAHIREQLREAVVRATCQDESVLDAVWEVVTNDMEVADDMDDYWKCQRSGG